ncbi:mannitol operon transcriptional antiterminator [Enterococcus sp. AZ135]
MYISRRVKQIILLLIDSREALSIKEVATRLKLSERTVYREMEDVRNQIEKQGLELASIPNKGMIIEGKLEKIQNFKAALSSEVKDKDYRAEERIDLILLFLLMEDDYVKLQSISSFLEVSLSTIKKDQAQVKEYLKKANISLISKMGEGIQVEGSLYQKHICLMDILTKNLDITILFAWLRKMNSYPSVFLKMTEAKYGSIFEETYQVIETMAIEQSVKVSDAERIEFILLVGLWRHAVTNKEELIFNESIGAQNALVEKIHQTLKQSVSNEVADDYSNYLMWIIQIYFGERDAESSGVNNISDLPEKIIELIQGIENRLGITLADNSDLIIGLQKHLSKAINRVNSGISIRNPLENEIKQNYHSLYVMVTESSSETFGKNFFPEDEIGYLVLYFAVALDKLVRKSFRVLVVCSSGMGSAKMLSSRLEREIPELYVKKITSLIELVDIDIQEYELVLSTVPLFLQDNDYMQVSPLLNTTEIDIIRQKIENHKYRSLNVLQKEKKDHSLNNGNSVETLYSLNECTNVAVRLLDNFKLLDMLVEKEKLSEKIIGVLQQEIILTEEEIENIKMDWEANYYQVPNRQYAILNCPLREKEKTALLVLNITRIGKNNEVDFNGKVLVICHSGNENQKVTALLSNLIISLSTDEETERILNSHNKKMIIQFIADELKKNLTELI